MKSLFMTNKHGHNEAIWKYVVKGSTARRRWYARRLASSMGAAWSAREAAAAQLQADVDACEISRETGFRVFSPGIFSEISEIVTRANQIIESDDVEVTAGTKDFLQQGYLNASNLTSDSPFLRFALRDDVIAAISTYLGVVPVLQKMDVWKSDNSPSQLRASQLFHCDWDDTTQLKVFVYASPVDKASGPLTLMEAHASDALRARIGYTYDRKGYRVGDERANAIVSPEHQHVLIGDSGTTVFVDTSRCFHYGSRVTEGAVPRIVGFFQFVTPTSFLYPPGGYRKLAPYRRFATQAMSERQRMVLGAV